ncbi:hypothetical protein C8J57DRAFT_1267715 [Mycena rebaudengoi]|nr:hypothetical protein C8J57DRAFT_1267715 [Mycena rebaudengoi]
MFTQVYPDLRNKELAAVNVQLLLQKDTVKRKLGSSTVIEAPTSSIFRTKLEEFLSSSASSTQPMLWPLVRRVEIRGNFAVLSTGITLVDLPGHGDNDDSRNNFADDYIKTADGIVFVTDARRAQNDRTTVEHMRTTSRPLLFPICSTLLICSVEESILVSQIQGADEVKLSGGRPLNQLRKRIIHHTQNRSTKPQNQHEIDEQIRNENQERVLILANARIAGVRKGVKDVFADLYGHMSSDEREAPKLSVYCVGSFDYLALTGSGNMPTIFHDVDMTEIPSLMSHLQSTGERRRLKWASRLFADADTFYEAVHHYFADGRHPGRLHTDNKTKALQLVRELDNSNKQRVKDLFDEIKDEFEQLAADLDKAVGTAAEQSIVVVKEFSKEMRYPSYKACMKNNGHHNSRDLNHELTRRILPAVQNNWNTVVNHRIPLLLKNVMEHIEDDTLAAIPRIVEALDIRGPRFEGLAESARRSLGIEVYISEMLGQSIQSIILAQRSVLKRFIDFIINLFLENGTRSFKTFFKHK